MVQLAIHDQDFCKHVNGSLASRERVLEVQMVPVVQALVPVLLLVQLQVLLLLLLAQL